MRIIFTTCLVSLLQIGFSQTINSLQPTEILGGIGAVLSVRGSDFGDVQADSYISFLQGDNNYMPSTTASSLHYLSWTDTLITLEMPTAFSGKVKIVRGGVEYWSPETLKVLANLDYRQVNPLDYIYLTDRNDRGGVTWSVHPDYWDNPAARSAIVDVFIEFRCKTGVNFILEPLTMPVPLDLGQGKNIIAPDTSLAGGVVGLNDYLWFSCILGVESFYYRHTQLLRFSTLEDWYFGTGDIPLGKSKFRYALMHELGHAVGLGHVNEHGQSMYPTITLWPSNDWSMRDSITTAEKEAMSYFVQRCQNNTFTACGVKSMQPILDCEDVLANASAVADFTVSTNEACAPLMVQFTNTSSSNATSFDWQFPGGNPSSSTAQNPPSVDYNSPGIYTVTLTATNSTGGSTSTQSIVVNGDPTANFTATISVLTASFTNNSSNSISYSWDFGDGTGSSNDPNPSHEYAADGTYTVVLTATNNCGANTFTQNVVITTQPGAGFSANTTVGCAALTVNFTDISSGDPVSWEWDFPGGAPGSSTEENPSVQYSTPGVYDVTLVVTSIGGSSSSFTQPGLITVNGAPSAGYTSSVIGSTVDFTNTSVGATSYIWNFGDQSSSTDENPTHTYDAPGTYTVSLAASNNCGTTIFEQTISLSTSTGEAAWVKGFKLFPNPNTGVFTIEMNGLPQEALAFTLFNTLGQHIKRETVDFSTGYLLHSFDYGTLPAGSYILRVQSDGQAMFVKVTLSK